MFKFLLILLLLAACGRDRGNQTFWPMDPRVADMANWAYACTQLVLGLDPSKYGPGPNVKGVEDRWPGAIGTWYPKTYTIKVWINSPNLSNIMLHEHGHIWFGIVALDYPNPHNLPAKEAFANYVNVLGLEQCEEPPEMIL